MSDSIDILNQLQAADLSSVPTGRPILKPCVTPLEIRKIEPVENKAGTGHNLNIELITTEELDTEAGEPVNPGFPLYDTISLVQTEKYDPWRRLAELKEAATGDKSGAFGDPADYVGMIVMANVQIERSEEYGDKNRVKRYVKQK